MSGCLREPLQPILQFLCAAPEREPIRANAARADAVDPKHAVVLTETPNQMLATGGMTTPVVGKDQEGWGFSCLVHEAFPGRG